MVLDVFPKIKLRFICSKRSPRACMDHCPNFIIEYMQCYRKSIYRLIYCTDSFFSVQDDDVPVRKVGRVHGERRVGELFCLDICNYPINMLMSLVNICFVLFLAAL